MGPRSTTWLLMTTTCGVFLLLLACGHEGRSAPRPSRPQSPGPWFPVYSDSLRGRDESTIIHQHARARRPSLIERKEPVFPPGHEPFGGRPGALVVETVIAPDGRIARSRILKGSRDVTTGKAIAEAFRGWRFSPATVDGKPVPVYYVLTISCGRRA